MKFVAKKEERINKAMQDTGLYSRREADKKIEGNKVKVNGRLATFGQILAIGDEVEIMSTTKTLKYFKYNKPVGEITAVINDDIMRGMHPIGRLDKESEGLLIYTNDPTLTETLLNPKNEVEKEYHVRVREKATPRVERILMEGIYTQEEKYKPARSVKISEDGHNIVIVLVEGKKHEIRRMLNALNLTIISLKRVRINNLRFGNLKPGKYAEIEKSKII